VLGRDLSPLLGHDPAQAAANSLHFNHERGSVPLAIFPSLEALLTRPALKRGVWMRWLEWTGTGCEQGPESG
jgi:DNA polymerase